MTVHVHRGPIVIDADVFGADLVRRSVLAERYEPIIVGRPAFISFQTAAELRYGVALNRDNTEEAAGGIEPPYGALQELRRGP